MPLTRFHWQLSGVVMTRNWPVPPEAVNTASSGSVT